MAFTGARGRELPLGLHLSALLEKLGVGPHADSMSGRASDSLSKTKQFSWLSANEKWTAWCQ